MKWFKSLSDPLKAAYIGAAALIIAAIISGIFLLASKDGTPLIPTPVPENSPLPSPMTVLPSPTPPVTVLPSNPTGEGTIIDLTSQTTTHTFTGTGGGITQPFQVGTNWSLDISCTSSTHLGPGQFLIYVVDNSDGKIISGPIDVQICTGLGNY